MGRLKKTDGWFARAEVYGYTDLDLNSIHARVMDVIEVRVPVYQRLECGHMLVSNGSLKGKIRSRCVYCEHPEYLSTPYDSTWEPVDGPSDPRLAAIARSALKAELSEIK